MSMPEVKPEIVFIFELLNEVRSGKLRIPKFTRSYVWKRQQMTELLDSINRQFPIGSLLVWETEELVSSRDWVGPLAVPEQPKGLAAYVLDGQQRLSTLTGVLMAAADEEDKGDDEDPGRWKIWFNLKENNFEHPKPGDKPESLHFPIWKLLDTVSFLQESQRILQENPEKGGEYVKKVQDLLRRFQSYKVPVIRIKNTDLNQAVDIFARLNSRGQPISADEMVSALSYRETPNSEALSDHISNILEELSGHGFGQIERVIILRSLLAIVGEDIYRTDWTRFTDQKRPELRDRLHTVVDQTQAALLKAIAFLHGLGIYNQRLLPYAMQLVILSAFFDECPQPTDDQKSFLERWFWVSSFVGWFASANPLRVDALIKEFRTQLAKNPHPEILENMRLDEPAQAFPSTFNMQTARTRTLLLVLLAQKPQDKNGEPIDAPWQRVAEYGPSALRYIDRSTVKDKTLSFSPANRILALDSQDHSQAKTWLLKLDGGHLGDILKSHAIPPDALDLLKRNDTDGFLQKRLDYLIQLDRDFMQSKGVVLPLDREVKPAAIDTD